MSDPRTHNPSTVHMDEQRRIGCATAQWFDENCVATHPLNANNLLEVLVCGEEAFERIARDIEAAQVSIDLVCWGFDPGMELRRDAAAKDWPRGQPFGSLLLAAAGRGVKVRLLVWYDKIASEKQNNLPGFTGDQRSGYFVQNPATTRDQYLVQGRIPPAPSLGGSDGRTPEQLRNDYCVEWWRNVMSSSQSIEPGLRIELKMRGGSTAEQVQASLTRKDSKEDPPSAAGAVSEKMLLERFATHHQKTLLIDYAWKGGEKAVGYVMGLNSVTDYWDSAEHRFEDPRREVDWARKSATAQALPRSRAVSRDPYQDYASRIQGPALEQVHQNFLKAWVREGGVARPEDKGAAPTRLKDVASPGSTIQVVRTQPQEDCDKTIKNVYWQAASFARNYIYIENQYFFYEAWVRHLKAQREAFMKGAQKAGVASCDASMLHLIAVIPWPEDDGMIPRTYDMVKSLGEADSLPNQHLAMQSQDEAWARWRQLPEDKRLDPDNAPAWDPVHATASQVQAPTKNHQTGELQGMGLKVLLARLVTRNNGKPMPRPEQDYRQIYIHSKLMLIDDAMFTVGSANLNVRSMAVDSEMNVVTNDHALAKELRQRVWGMHVSGFKASAGGNGTPLEIANAFRSWQDALAANKKALRDHEPIGGFVVPFEDGREVHFRHA